MTAISEVSGAGSFAGDHRRAEWFFWITGFAECRAITGLFQSLHDQARDAHWTLVGGVALDSKARFGIEFGVLGIQCKPAASDVAYASPFAIDYVENFLDQILSRAIATFANGTRVLIFYLRASLLKLCDTHGDSLQDVERFKSGD